MKKCKRLLAFVLAAVLLAAIAVPAVAQESVAVDLSIMSFNIRCLNGNDTGKTHWDARRDAVCDYVNNSGADVICMQEVVQSQADDMMMNLSDQYAYMYYPREDVPSPEGLMTVFDVNRFELLHNEVFWLSETPDEMTKGWEAACYRICVLTVLQDKASGYVFNVYNVHLDHQSSAAQVNGLKVVLERMKKYPEGFNMVMGDFNVKNTNPAYAAIAEKMQDCQTAAPNADLGCTYNSWIKVTEGESIDFIFVDREGATPKDFSICRDTWSDDEGSGYLYSDHYAIRSNVTFTYTDEVAAAKVTRRIADLPETVTLNNAVNVAEIRAAFDGLTDQAKALVTNLSVLESAEQVIADWPYGDVDGDGQLSAADALLALQSVVGKAMLTTAQQRVGDVDGNQKVDSADALEMLKKIVGKITRFPVEEQML